MLGRRTRLNKLIEIKKILDDDINGNKFIIVRTDKNIEFMREYGLTNKDVKNIIREMSVDDCFAGPEFDRNPIYNGWIFKFSPMFENVKLYIKIRIENIGKAVCISVHEFGKYDEVN
ncbi:MAG: hypothetical protein E7311_05135 [Clostridiales bacterium]|nr:hypothetical protein [Clostridiales bacterium]